MRFRRGKDEMSHARICSTLDRFIIKPHGDLDQSGVEAGADLTLPDMNFVARIWKQANGPFCPVRR
jgi:hypothetical protein